MAALCVAYDKPLVSTSANLSGLPPHAVVFEEVQEQFRNRNYIVNGGVNLAEKILLKLEMHSQVSYIDKDNDAMEKYVVIDNPIEPSISFYSSAFSKQSGIDYEYGRLLVPLGEFDKVANAIFFFSKVDVELMLPFLLQGRCFSLCG